MAKKVKKLEEFGYYDSPEVFDKFTYKDNASGSSGKLLYLTAYMNYDNACAIGYYFFSLKDACTIFLSRPPEHKEKDKPRFIIYKGWIDDKDLKCN